MHAQKRKSLKVTVRVEDNDGLAVSQYTFHDVGKVELEERPAAKELDPFDRGERTRTHRPPELVELRLSEILATGVTGSYLTIEDRTTAVPDPERWRPTSE